MSYFPDTPAWQFVPVQDSMLVAHLPSTIPVSFKRAMWHMTANAAHILASPVQSKQSRMYQSVSNQGKILEAISAACYLSHSKDTPGIRQTSPGFHLLWFVARTVSWLVSMKSKAALSKHGHARVAAISVFIPAQIRQAVLSVTDIEPCVIIEFVRNQVISTLQCYPGQSYMYSLLSWRDLDSTAGC